MLPSNLDTLNKFEWPTEFWHSEWTVPDIQHHACAQLLLII